MNKSSDINTVSDIELIARYKSSGDKEIVGALFKRYTHLVLGVCMKYLKDEDESKDAVMDVFEKLLVDLKKHSIENFKSWLHTVSKNHCLMKLRAGKNKHFETLSEEESSIEVVEMNLLLHPDNTQEKEAQLSLLEKGINHLNDEQKKCIGLFYLEEKSYTEVSEITGYSMLQVKSFIQNGKRNLKIFMEKRHDE